MRLLLVGDAATMAAISAAGLALVLGWEYTGLPLEDQVKKLTAGLSVSVLGYTLVDEPVAFVLAAIYREVVDIILGIVNSIAVTIIDIYALFERTVVGGIGAALAVPIDALDTLIGGTISTVDQFIVTLAALSGPAAPLVLIAGWGIVVLVLIYTITQAWRGYKWVRSVVL
jgi:hypothetical protein